MIAKALHPDATPSEEARLEAFKAFSAWKGDRDAARRRWFDPRVVVRCEWRAFLLRPDLRLLNRFVFAAHVFDIDGRFYCPKRQPSDPL